MSKQHHYIVSYNTERKEWELDADAEAVKYDNGTIYDYETDTWHRDYDGDGVFFPESERLGEIIGSAVSQLNKERQVMKTWKVSIWAMEEVEAGTKEEAEEMVNDMLIGCLIKTSDFELDTEEAESE
jgi:hypothetical protein